VGVNEGDDGFGLADGLLACRVLEDEAVTYAFELHEGGFAAG
jgi:hypothetical protein